MDVVVDGIHGLVEFKESLLLEVNTAMQKIGTRSCDKNVLHFKNVDIHKMAMAHMQMHCISYRRYLCQTSILSDISSTYFDKKQISGKMK